MNLNSYTKIDDFKVQIVNFEWCFYMRFNFSIIYILDEIEKVLPPHGRFLVNCHHIRFDFSAF